MATQLYLGTEQPISQYYDRKSKLSPQEYFEKLKTTATVYVGNLSIGTSEDSIYTFFEQAGRIKALHMGNNNQGVPAGFCFIEFETHEEAVNAVEYLSYLKLEDRVIRVDYDVGYDPSRQVGRGQNGIQVRDQMRSGEDKQRLNADKELLRQQYNKRGGLGNSNRGGFGNSFNSNNNRNYNNNRYNNYNNNRYNSSEGGYNRGGYNNNRGNYNNNNRYQNRNNFQYSGDNQTNRNQKYPQNTNQSQQYNMQKQNSQNINQKRGRDSRSVSQERENNKKVQQYEQENDNNDIDYNSD